MNFGTLAKAGAIAAATGVSLLAAPLMAQDTVTLRMSTWLPPQHHLISDTLPTWIAAVEEASNGTLKIQLDPAPVAQPPAQYDIVRDGVADMGYHVMAYTPGPFEIVRAVELPFLAPSAEIASQAAWDWYERNIGFEEEFKDIKVVTIMASGPGVIYTKEPVETLEDLEGVKLRVGGGGVRIAEALGAVPVALPSSQSYESIQKGVADGTMFPMEAAKGHRISELVKYHTEVPNGLFSTPFAIIMNQAKYDSLSDEHKAVLDQVGGLAGAKMLGQGWDRADVAGREFAEANDAVFYTLPEEELKRWEEKVSVMNDDWIALANERGLDGEALLEDLRATVEKFSE